MEIKKKKMYHFRHTGSFFFFLKPEKKVLIAVNKNKLHVVSVPLSSILYTP